MSNMIDKNLTALLNKSGSPISSDIARLLDVDNSAINNWLRGVNGITHHLAEKLAWVLDVDLNDLVANGDYVTPQSPMVTDWPEFWGKLHFRAIGLRNSKWGIKVLARIPPETPTDAEDIVTMLEKIEARRVEHDLEWFVKPCGKLGARKLTVVEY